MVSTRYVAKLGGRAEAWSMYLFQLLYGRRRCSVLCCGSIKLGTHICLFLAGFRAGGAISLHYDCRYTDVPIYNTEYTLLSASSRPLSNITLPWRPSFLELFLFSSLLCSCFIQYLAHIPSGRCHFLIIVTLSRPSLFRYIPAIEYENLIVASFFSFYTYLSGCSMTHVFTHLPPWRCAFSS